MTRSPYKRFDYFTYEDRDLFFGRDEETLRLVGDILSGRLLVLFSPSGSGKSSLINAGARPVLEARGWNTVYVRLDDEPITAIRAALEHSGIPELKALPADCSLSDALRSVWRERKAELAVIAGSVDSAGRGDASFEPRQQESQSERIRPLVIFVDQFEEFFVVFRDQPEIRAAFLRELAAIRYDETLPVRIVLSLRDEYFAHFHEFRGEIRSIFEQNANIRLGSLSSQSAMDAIAKPAHAFGGKVDAGLAQQIINDLTALNPTRDGVLPIMLQVVCDALWQNAPDPEKPSLSNREYQRLGGAGAIISSMVEQSLESIDRSRRPIVCRLFRALSTPDRTKRFRPLADLRELLGMPTGDKLPTLLTELRHANLLREELRRGEPWYEFRHDYLVRHASDWADREERRLAQQRYVVRLVSLTVLAPLLITALVAIWQFNAFVVRFAGGRQYEDQREELCIVRRFNPFGYQVLTGIYRDDLNGFGPRDRILTGLDLPWSDPSNWRDLSDLLSAARAEQLAIELANPAQADRGPARLTPSLWLPNRADALNALARVDPAVLSGLLVQLKDSDSFVRTSAAEALGWLGNPSPDVLYGLLALLKDPDSFVRRKAAWALGMVGNPSPEALGGLLALLKASKSDERETAVWILGWFGDPSPEILNGMLALLKDPDSFVRRRATEALGKLGNPSPEVLNGLLTMLKDSNSDVRSTTAETLGNLGNTSPEVLNGLLALLKDSESRVRAMAAEALGELGNPSPEVVKGLLALLQDSESSVRQNAAEALVKFGKTSPEVLNGLLTMLKDSNSDVRSTTTETLGKLGNTSPEVINGLLALLKDSENRVRAMVAEALGTLGNPSPEVLNGLSALRYDSNSIVRLRAAEALGWLGNSSPEVLNGLSALLHDSDSIVRLRAAWALGWLGNPSPEVLNGLLALLKDSESRVCATAAWALAKLGDTSPEVLNGLLALLKDSNRLARHYAAVALGMLGNSSPEVVNGLLALLKDSEGDVRSTAARALGTIVQSHSDEWRDARLLDLLRNDDSAWRELGGIGLAYRDEKLSPRTIEQVKKLREDRRPWVRMAALQALVAIEERKMKREQEAKDARDQEAAAARQATTRPATQSATTQP